MIKTYMQLQSLSNEQGHKKVFSNFIFISLLSMLQKFKSLTSPILWKIEFKLLFYVLHLTWKLNFKVKFLDFLNTIETRDLKFKKKDRRDMKPINSEFFLIRFIDPLASIYS